ncbi:hypothetical protein [Okeania sp. KiyG1]|uniref:hypothetical protein n=1 Tax=Okeania sp. KiyG1 TaxID=2720165 RepID=UPI0019AD646B|nr:hypothetical protein [Okeania sp. KiyG1]GGA23730.1 hypothetical protein CYANOKiyG1_39050 [Okeania sp. KiyG1]
MEGISILQAKEIKAQLKSLIQEASSVDSDFAKRLNEVNQWIKHLKPGTLTAKKFVMLFLKQLIQDSKIFLILKSIPKEIEREFYYQKMTPTEQYWHKELFPKWLQEKDPKFYIWKQKLMSGKFTQEDREIIQAIANQIELNQGTALQRYIVDLSMATDIIVSGSQEKPLCIQLTSLSKKFAKDKAEEWQDTLVFWEIDRGLFLSYNPGRKYFQNELVKTILDNSDNLQKGNYLKCNL